MDSILTSIKKLMGIPEEYHHFDDDLIMHINMVFMTLHQMGVGTSEPFEITGDSEEWSDFLEDKTYLNGVKTYVHLKTKKAFDPPTSGSVKDAHDTLIAELEWRLTNAFSISNNQEDD